MRVITRSAGPYDAFGVTVVRRKLLQSARCSLCTEVANRVPVTARAQLSALQTVLTVVEAEESFVVEVEESLVVEVEKMLVVVAEVKAAWARARIKRVDFMMVLKLKQIF